MKDSRVWTSADDRRVGRSSRAMPPEHLFNQRLYLILLHSRLHSLHRLAMSFGGDVGGGLHDLYFFRALEYAHLVNDRSRIHNRLRRMNRLAVPPTHFHQLFDDRVVQLSIGSQPVVENVCSIEIPVQLCFKLLDRKSFVSAELTLCTLDAPATAVPNLSFRI